MAGAVGDVPLAGRGAVLDKSLERDGEPQDKWTVESEYGYVVGTAVVMGIAMTQPWVIVGLARTLTRPSHWKLPKLRCTD